MVEGRSNKEIAKALGVSPNTIKTHTRHLYRKLGVGSRSDAVEVARILEDSGIQAITVHGRTRSQGYSGVADWEVIAQVADALLSPHAPSGAGRVRRRNR